MKITDKVKSYDDVCKIKGIDPVKGLPFPDAKTPEEIAVNGFTKIIRTIEVLNEGWQPDWSNSNQMKYYPWFDMRPEYAVGSGVGFSYDGSYYAYSYSSVGSRLVLKSRQLVHHIQEYFLKEYSDFMVMS